MFFTQILQSNLRGETFLFSLNLIGFVATVKARFSKTINFVIKKSIPGAKSDGLYRISIIGNYETCLIIAHKALDF